MEQVVVRAIAHDRNESRISILGVLDQPGIAARVFEPLAEAEIIVDMIIQNDSQTTGRTDLSFTVPKDETARATELAESICDDLGGQGVRADESIAKISVVGLGMRSHSGVAAKMFKALSAAGINIQMISTSEIKISVVIDERFTELAVRTLHEAFDLSNG